MNKLFLLTLLLNTPGVSSYEKILGISGVVAKQLKKFGPTKIDFTGSVITYQKKSLKSPTILISAHIDEVGFFISKKIGKYQYRTLPMGDIDPKSATGTRVNLGVIKSKIKNPRSFNQLYLETKRKQINLLDPVYWQRKITINNSLIKSPALDNKVGVTVLILLAKKLSENKFNRYNFVFAGISQEEIGNNNYQALIDQTKPDLIIDLDSAYTTTKTTNLATNIPVLGQGAAIQIIGKGINYEKSWLFNTLRLLKKNQIKFQLEIPSPNEGETLFSRINNYPGKFLQINIPVAKQHEPQSMANLKDIDSCIKIVEYLLCQSLV